MATPNRSWQSQKQRPCRFKPRRSPSLSFSAFCLPPATSIPPAKFTVSFSPPPDSSQPQLRLALAHLPDSLTTPLATKIVLDASSYRGRLPSAAVAISPWPGHSGSSLALVSLLLASPWGRGALRLILFGVDPCQEPPVRRPRGLLSLAFATGSSNSSSRSRLRTLPLPSPQP